VRSQLPAENSLQPSALKAKQISFDRRPMEKHAATDDYCGDFSRFSPSPKSAVRDRHEFAELDFVNETLLVFGWNLNVIRHTRLQ
jgi:hypothetical protein